MPEVLSRAHKKFTANTNFIHSISKFLFSFLLVWLVTRWYFLCIAVQFFRLRFASLLLFLAFQTFLMLQFFFQPPRSKSVRLRHFSYTDDFTFGLCLLPTKSNSAKRTLYINLAANNSHHGIIVYNALIFIIKSSSIINSN